jgi:hypothetical protein
MGEVFYIVEPVAQSREKREDLSNEDVVTLPIVGGPYESHKEARREGNWSGYPIISGWEE